MSTIASLPTNNLRYLLKWLGLTSYFIFISYFINSDIVNGRVTLQRFDPNEFSLTIYLLIVLLGMSYLKKTITITQFLFLLILPMGFSIMIGSRMGFIGVLLLTLGPILSSPRKRKIISIKRSLIILSLIALPSFYLMNNTVLGERFIATTSNTEALTENHVEGTFFENFGDRGVYYVLGWKALTDKPITGIGLNNFKHKYYYQVLHSEFMIQLAELGLIGFFFYVSFNISLLSAIQKERMRMLSISFNNYLLIIFFVLLLSSSVLFLYKSYSIAIIYGLLILLTNKKV